jgi:hypothetical protein
MYSEMYTGRHAACVIVTDISSQIRRFRIRAICLMSVALHNKLEIPMLGYERKIEV